jgi:hypothetical protein
MSYIRYSLLVPQDMSPLRELGDQTLETQGRDTRQTSELHVGQGLSRLGERFGAEALITPERGGLITHACACVKVTAGWPPRLALQGEPTEMG